MSGLEEPENTEAAAGGHLAGAHGEGSQGGDRGTAGGGSSASGAAGGSASTGAVRGSSEKGGQQGEKQGTSAKETHQEMFKRLSNLKKKGQGDFWQWLEP
eukprot:130687-Pelagomonas_calceolata.AAC.1